MNFDEIFKKWIDTGKLTNEDIFTILLEYDNTFNDGTLTIQQIEIFLSHPIIQIELNSIITEALSKLGLKKGYKWWTIRNSDGQLIRRMWAD